MSYRSKTTESSAPPHKLIFHIFAALAEFGKGLIRERTLAGLKAARERGRRGGRPRLPAGHPRVVVAHEMRQDDKLAIDDICKTLRISRSTFYRYCAMAIPPSTAEGLRGDAFLYVLPIHHQEPQLPPGAGPEVEPSGSTAWFPCVEPPPQCGRTGRFRSFRTAPVRSLRPSQIPFDTRMWPR